MGRLSAGALALAAAALAVWARWIEPRRLVVRRRELRPPGWPRALDGLVVAAASDLHAGGAHVNVARIERVVAALAGGAPDLVLWLGDYVDPVVTGGPTPSRGAVARALAALRPPRGAFAVLGNHDAAYGGSAMRTALESAGIRVLENDAAPAGEGLWVAGLADRRRARPDVEAALAPVPEDAALLVLAHDPDLFPRVPARAALTLSGHTHGGQVALPGLVRRVIPSLHGRRFERGLVAEGGRLLLITSGVGMSSRPVRLGRPPEVLLLTLRSGL